MAALVRRTCRTRTSTEVLALRLVTQLLFSCESSPAVAYRVVRRFSAAFLVFI